MGQALYRKYRPKSLSELIGQEHITTALANALKTGRLSHAYLLTGPKGVGKTSIARILAHEINGLPYGSEAHLDIIEIDAASNRRIEEIRDLRDRIHTAPAAAKYKVYIIDEVHMLTPEAFNALLKTLEEPPAHVVFILATTEAHKLPETIISRTQRYSFRPVASEQIVTLLQNIAKKEKLAVDDEALQLIAIHGDGSLRDSISLLDQASNTTDKIGKADVERLLGLAPESYIQTLKEATESRQAPLVVSTLSSIYAQGYEPALVAAQLGEAWRADILTSATHRLQTKAIMPLLRHLLDVPAARQPRQLLELVLLDAAFTDETGQTLAPEASTRSLKQVPTPAKHSPTSEKASQAVSDTQSSALTENSKSDKPVAPQQTNNSAEVVELWQQVLDEIKKQYNTLYGIARMATPELEGDRLTLHLKFAFHQKRLNEAKNLKIFSDVFERLRGRPIQIVCVVTSNVAPVVPTPDVTIINNIFGGAELLES